jgi:hypothetical protein
LGARASIITYNLAKRFLDACENRHDEIQRPAIGFSRIDRNAMGSVDRVIGAFAEFAGQKVLEMNRGLEDDHFARIGDPDLYLDFDFVSFRLYFLKKVDIREAVVGIISSASIVL